VIDWLACFEEGSTMQIVNFVRGVPFAEIKHGKLLQFFDTNSNVHIGMKVYGEQCDGVLVLKGHPPSERPTISWVLDNMRPPWGDALLLEIPDAMLVNKAFAKLPDGHAPKTGDLTIHHDGTTMYLTKTGGSPLSAMYVDMKTGKTTKAKKTRMPPLVVSKWAIVIPTVEAGELLIKFPEDRAVQ
jgi:hypothetical protein